MGKRLEKIRELAKKDSIYILLLAFIIVFNVLAAVSSMPADKAKARKDSQALLAKREAIDKTDELMLRREEVEKAFAKKPLLSLALNLTSLAFLLIVALGFLLDGALLAFRFKGRTFDISTYRHGRVGWSIADVARVAILFLFFAYLMVIIDAFLYRILPVLKNDNFRMMFNSSISDCIAAMFVVYFAVYKNRAGLIELGLTLKNLFRNIFYGIAGYIAAVPVFLIAAFLVLIAVKLVGYAPRKQPVVELFMREGNPAFLVFSSLFTSIFGPVIEELFFRGFMYNAVKKLTGIFWATMLTAAVFAALHTNVVGFLPIMVLGVLLAHMYEKTGSLVSSITIHIIHNLAMVYVVFLVKGIKAI